MTELKTSLHRLGALCAVTVAAVALARPAAASDVTFAVIGPHEYELPVNYDQFNAIVQYGEINSNDRVWGTQGHEQPGNGGALYEGLTKYVYFFDFKSIPGIGFAAEVIEPEVHISNVPGGITGLGGTIFGFATWFKPNSSSTLGFQSFGQAPDSTGVLTHGQAWNNLSSILYDYQWKHFDLTGDAGMVFRFDSRYKDQYAHGQSDVFHINARFGFKVHPIIEPFLAVDWTTAGDDRNLLTGQQLLDSSFQETTFGGGFNVQFTPKIGMAIHYARGLEGHNTTVTNAAYFKLAFVF